MGWDGSLNNERRCLLGTTRVSEKTRRATVDGLQ